MYEDMYKAGEKVNMDREAEVKEKDSRIEG